MRTWTIATVTSAIVLGVLDALWITLFAGPTYRAEMGDAVRADFLIAPAMAFYVIFLLGLTHFVTMRTLQSSTLVAVRDAAFFGFVSYGTYTLTGWAVLEPFNAMVALPDLVWGGVVSTSTVLVARVVIKRMAPAAMQRL